MAILVKANGNYGQPIGTSKYSPLETPAPLPADVAVYSGLLTNRRALMTSAGLLGGPLTLMLPSWQQARAAEAGRLPPLVVISSNRSAWLSQGIAAGDAQLVSEDLDQYDGPADLRALRDYAGRGVSPPVYAPHRIGANRSVYIVVHAAEYADYRQAFTPYPQIGVVGWSFGRGARVRERGQLVGFGASRFAAIQFCQTLRATAAAPWTSAWLIDDNVVALKNFAGFAAVEDKLEDNVCAGLEGCSKADTKSANVTFANAQLDAGRGVTVAVLPKPLTTGLLQQAVLWNLDRLANEDLNFGPAFVTSAEDLSLARYLDLTSAPYQFYKGVGVVKEVPEPDETKGGGRVTRHRSSLTGLIVAAESAAVAPQGAAPPPPIMVSAPGGPELTLSDFVIDAMRSLGGQGVVDPAAAAVAQSQAVEQLAATAIGAVGCVSAAALQTTFHPNAANPLTVATIDIP